MKKETVKDTSPYAPKRRQKLTLELAIKELPWTERQQEFIRMATNKNVNIVMQRGPAGSSKTLMAVFCLLQRLKEKKITQIAYSRVPVESCVHGVGFLKGELQAKMQPYLEPCLEKLNEFLPPSQVSALLNNDHVAGIPVGFLRGMNITDGLIFDEAQNASTHDLLLAMSRMARFSSLFICADEKQIDVKKSQSGFSKVFEAFSTDEAKKHGIYTWEWQNKDIMRSPHLAFIVETFESLST